MQFSMNFVLCFRAIPNKVMPGNQQALSLYRLLLRKGKQLRFTDKEFYFKRIRAEFEKNKHVTDKSEIEHNIKVNAM